MRASLTICSLFSLLAISAACSSPAAVSTGTDDVSTSEDTLAVDVTPTSDTGKDIQLTCPGAPGCACSTDGECSTKHCLADENGAKNCARSCSSDACPAGFGCGSLDGAALCIPSRLSLCAPCLKDSSECATPGLSGAACVKYGKIGNFCGTACLSDRDCGAGYQCKSAERIEGGMTQQCVRVDSSGAPTECACSPSAIAQNRQTTCAIPGGLHACGGLRSCESTGLTLCNALTPTAESCDGIDNDCNGATDEGTCDDGKVCTDDLCGGTSGCTHTNNKATCSDGNACTANDTCTGGFCKGGGATNCDDGNPCTDDSCATGSGCKYANNKGKCEDGDPCTIGDKCAGAFCLPGAATVCNDGNPCTADVCLPEGCTYTAVSGGVCSDGDNCTIGDSCAVGKCSGKPRDCDDGSACTTDSCAGGLCVHTATDGTCDDNNACTDGDVCTGGICVGIAKSCVSSSSCVISTCAAGSGGCAYASKSDGADCSDGDACTSGDACSSGTCVGSAANCDDKNVCTEDSCASSTGCGHVGKPGSCDDGNACTVSDDCGTGVCVGTPKNCSDNNPCTDDSCASSGGCKSVNNSGTCDDGEPCTTGDTCVLGACSANPTDCNDANACTSDSCTAGVGCVHNATNGAICDSDGSACTSDSCVGNTCTVGNSKVCDDGKPCTSDACDPVSGNCNAPPKSDGATCDDGKPCTAGDICSGGACAGPSATTCTDADPCTDDSCDPVSGCKHVGKSTGVCDLDASACTPDTCVSGTCTAGSAKVCNDGNVCTTDSCDAITGSCVFAPVSDGIGCNDGNNCTTSDQCTGGTCAGSQPATVVSTFAGQSSAGGTDDANPLVASFNGPRGVVVASNGSVFVADSGNHKIRRIADDGAVTTWAGLGITGYQEGTGTGARFTTPEGILAVGSNLYVSDSSIQNIRKIDSGATTTFIAGLASAPGFGINNAGGFTDGTAANARFSSPAGLALDVTSSTLYVADTGNHAIRAIDLLGGNVSTIAGNGTPGSSNGNFASALFNSPGGLWLSPDAKKLYVSEIGGNMVRVVDFTAGTVSTLAGTGSIGSQDGANASATFHAITGISGDSSTLWVTDCLNNRIRTITASTTSTLTGSTAAIPPVDGTFDVATFNQPGGIVWVSTGLWYVADTKNNRIRRLFDPNAGCIP